MYNAEHAMKTTYSDIGPSLHVEILQAKSIHVVSHYPEVNGIELHDIFILVLIYRWTND